MKDSIQVDVTRKGKRNTMPRSPRQNSALCKIKKTEKMPSRAVRRISTLVEQLDNDGFSKSERKATKKKVRRVQLQSRLYVPDGLGSQMNMHMQSAGSRAKRRNDIETLSFWGVVGKGQLVRPSLPSSFPPSRAPA